MLSKSLLKPVRHDDDRTPSGYSDLSASESVCCDVPEEDQEFEENTQDVVERVLEQIDIPRAESRMMMMWNASSSPSSRKASPLSSLVSLSLSEQTLLGENVRNIWGANSHPNNKSIWVPLPEELPSYKSWDNGITAMGLMKKMSLRETLIQSNPLLPLAKRIAITVENPFMDLQSSHSRTTNETLSCSCDPTQISRWENVLRCFESHPSALQLLKDMAAHGNVAEINLQNVLENLETLSQIQENFPLDLPDEPFVLSQDTYQAFAAVRSDMPRSSISQATPVRNPPASLTPRRTFSSWTPLSETLHTHRPLSPPPLMDGANLPDALDGAGISYMFLENVHFGSTHKKIPTQSQAQGRPLSQPNSQCTTPIPLEPPERSHSALRMTGEQRARRLSADNVHVADDSSFYQHAADRIVNSFYKQARRRARSASTDSHSAFYYMQTPFESQRHSQTPSPAFPFPEPNQRRLTQRQANSTSSSSQYFFRQQLPSFLRPPPCNPTITQASPRMESSFSQSTSAFHHSDTSTSTSFNSDVSRYWRDGSNLRSLSWWRERNEYRRQPTHIYVQNNTAANVNSISDPCPGTHNTSLPPPALSDRHSCWALSHASRPPPGLPPPFTPVPTNNDIQRISQQGLNNFGWSTSDTLRCRK